MMLLRPYLSRSTFFSACSSVTVPGSEVQSAQTIPPVRSRWHDHTVGGKKSPQIGPKKGINKEYKDFSSKCPQKNRVLKPRFFTFPRGPGGCRELREAGRNHFHLPWYPLVRVVTSYGRKPSWGIFQTEYGYQVVISSCVF